MMPRGEDLARGQVTSSLYGQGHFDSVPEKWTRAGVKIICWWTIMW